MNARIEKCIPHDADAGEPLRTIFDDMVDQCGSR
jgi:hypothetical protein